MSEENKKRLKEYQKIIVNLKNMLHKCKYVNKKYVTKLLLQGYFLFVLLLIFKRENGVLIIK